MRIISGHDYYDSAAQFGVDTTVCFIRNKNEDISSKIPLNIKLPSFNLMFLNEPRAKYPWRRNAESRWCPIFVVIADKIWKGMRNKDTNKVFFTHDTFVAYLKEHNFRYEPTDYRWMTLSVYEPMSELYFGEYEVQKTLMDWMIANGVVIITGELNDKKSFDVVINNDNLKDYEFFRVVDAFQTHQRIEQWVTGVLPQAGKPTVEIVDDKVIAEKHGFYKWSFRTPGKKGI